MLGGGAVGVLDGAQPGGDPGFAGGDGLAVAPAVGVFGQAAAGPLDLADVGLALVGVGGDGEQGDGGGGVVQDEADRLGFGVAAARARIRGPSVSGQACSVDTAFRTADLWLIHAADCCSRYSSWTCCGSGSEVPECRRLELYQNSMYLTTSRRACSRVGYWVR